MTGSIGDIAEQVLEEVRSAKLTKLAQHHILKEAETKPAVQTEIGKFLLKLSEEIRNDTLDITTQDLENFLNGVKHAVRAA